MYDEWYTVYGENSRSELHNVSTLPYRNSNAFLSWEREIQQETMAKLRNFSSPSHSWFLNNYWFCWISTNYGSRLNLMSPYYRPSFKSVLILFIEKPSQTITINPLPRTFPLNCWSLLPNINYHPLSLIRLTTNRYFLCLAASKFWPIKRP